MFSCAEIEDILRIIGKNFFVELVNLRTSRTAEKRYRYEFGSSVSFRDNFVCNLLLNADVEETQLLLAVMGSNPGHGIAGFSVVGDRFFRVNYLRM